MSELRSEFRTHYEHTSIYRHLIEDAVEIEREADHLHRLAHNYYASFNHILRDLEEIDELAHHLHEMVDAADRGYYGHVHGNTHHVHQLLSSLNSAIHSMESTVRYDASHRHHDEHGHDDHGHGSAANPAPRVQVAGRIFRAFLNR